MLGVPLERFATPAISDDHELNIQSAFDALGYRINQNIEALVRNIERSNAHDAQRLKWGIKGPWQDYKSGVLYYDT